MLTDETRLRLARDVTFQAVGNGEDTVILRLGSGYLYTCNNTTAGFLSALDAQRGFGEVVDLLGRQYDVPREKLRDDLQALAAKLMQEKMIVAE